MRKCSGTSTLRPLTTTSALGAGSGASSSITMVVRSESTEWLDMLGNSFRFSTESHALRARLSSDSRRRGMRGFAAHRRKVSTTHLLPLVGGCWRFRLSAAVRHSRVVVADGSPCSPGSASKFADMFSVLHTGLIWIKLPPSSGIGNRKHAGHVSA